MAVFFSLGIGMALPFLLVAAVPGIVAWLPRPRAWMLYVRYASGVLLLGTAAWLLLLLSADLSLKATGSIGLLLSGLVLLRFLVARRPMFKRSGAIATSVLASGVMFIAGIAPSPPGHGGTADWAVFDPASINDAVAAGRTVLVDVTATWCLTCKLNELSTLDRKVVQNRPTDSGTLLMRADWSHPNAGVTAYLRSFSRFGIPFGIVYGPGRRNGMPLPELLTPGLLMAALDDAQPLRAARDAAARHVERELSRHRGDERAVPVLAAQGEYRDRQRGLLPFEGR
ncbi:thioredoxin family protein [Hyphomicrobiales bacterium BP6-180914]|uniref:Thioredoxin family protein n=1 Tax=Lichenifustis flavocetrariae TaxID=2949735 RepID=A0AA41YV18_9HYPH|nr:thioredoxin family protein [Lichenifustis flavocetrariae]MCW6507845.1 thioredoxin family protein [Lichenifustis flavocetrariae]